MKFLGILIQIGMILLALSFVFAPFYFLKKKYKKLDLRKKLWGYGLAIVLFFVYIGIHAGLLAILRKYISWLFKSIEDGGYKGILSISLFFIFSPLWMFKTLKQKIIGSVVAFIIVFLLFIWVASQAGRAFM